MTYNYVMSLAFVSIALQKVVIGKEIIGIDTIQINHYLFQCKVVSAQRSHQRFRPGKILD